jgi:hypothetical protein
VAGCPMPALPPTHASHAGLAIIGRDRRMPFGKRELRPPSTRIGSAVSIVIYAIIGALALDRVGLIDVVADVVSTVGMWTVFAY